MTPQQDLICELEQAVARGSPWRRAETLARVTDLFVVGAAQFSEEQIALFDDVLARLVDTIEVAALAELARRLAIVPNAPRNVVRTLACVDEIAVAGPLLTHSERLDEVDLIRTAQSKSQDHLLAMSRRKALPQVLTDILVERGNAIVVRSTATNGGARFSSFGYERLIGHSTADDELALVVAGRPDLPRHLFLHLVAKASDTVRTRLQALNPQVSGEIKTIVAEIAGRIQNKFERSDRDYTPVLALVDYLHKDGRLTEREVRAFAIAGQFEQMTAALSILGELPIAAVEHALLQERAEMVLVIAKAVGFSWSTVKAVLTARAAARGIASNEIEHCLASFERLKPSTAQQVLKFHRSRSAGSA
jgi:uncharacterized protein (DUF2336 family)